MPDPWSTAYPSNIRHYASFTAFRDVMGTRNPPFVLRPLDVARDDQDMPFTSIARTAGAGSLVSHEFASESLTLTRSRSQIAGSELDGYQLFLQMEGVWHLAQDGREQEIKPGSVVLLDLNVPFRSIKRGRWRHRAISVPRADIDAWVSPDWRRGGLVLGGGGLGKVIAGYARALTDEIGQLTPAEGSAGLKHLCQLFALNATMSAGRGQMAGDALRAAKLTQIRRYIELNLSGELRPAAAAADNGVSERTLHALFEPTGTSFAAYVLGRRLERCRTLLADEAWANRPIIDIAHCAGFNSLPTFYRAFRRAFGMAPTEFRVTAPHIRGI